MALCNEVRSKNLPHHQCPLGATLGSSYTSKSKKERQPGYKRQPGYQEKSLIAHGFANQPNSRVTQRQQRVVRSFARNASAPRYPRIGSGLCQTKEDKLFDQKQVLCFYPLGVPFVWVATEGEGHKLEFEALSVLSIGCLPLFACENKIWPIRHLSIRHRWLAPLAAWSGKCQKFWDATMPTHWHCCTTAC